MPQIFKVGSYVIFFWSNENIPLEPIHVHIAENVPQPNATKIWITKSGKCVLANNNSDIPSKDLKNLMEIIEARSFEVIRKWQMHFDDISYYC